MARDGVGFEWMDKGSLPGSHIKISSGDSQDGNVDKRSKEDIRMTRYIYIYISVS